MAKSTKDEVFTIHHVRWAMAKGIMCGVLGTCSAIVGALNLMSIVKGLLE